jgi:hypothetical protein
MPCMCSSRGSSSPRTSARLTLSGRPGSGHRARRGAPFASPGQRTGADRLEGRPDDRQPFQQRVVAQICLARREELAAGQYASIRCSGSAERGPCVPAAGASRSGPAKRPLTASLDDSMKSPRSGATFLRIGGTGLLRKRPGDTAARLTVSRRPAARHRQRSPDPPARRPRATDLTRPARALPAFPPSCRGNYCRRQAGPYRVVTLVA